MYVARQLDLHLLSLHLALTYLASLTGSTLPQGSLDTRSLATWYLPLANSNGAVSAFRFTAECTLTGVSLYNVQYM